MYRQAGSQSVADPESSTTSCPEQKSSENGIDLILDFLEDISPFGGTLITCQRRPLKFNVNIRQILFKTTAITSGRSMGRLCDHSQTIFLNSKESFGRICGNLDLHLAASNLALPPTMIFHTALHIKMKRDLFFSNLLLRLDVPLNVPKLYDNILT